MGSPMAVHLQNAGHHVVGYNRSPEKTAALVAAAGAAAGLDRRRPSPTPTSSPSWSRTPRTSRGAPRAARTASSPTPGPARSSSTSPPSAPTSPPSSPGRPRSAASASWTPPSPAGRPAPRTPPCRSWSAAPRRTSRPPCRYLDVVGKTDRARRSHGLRTDRQGRQPAHRGRQHRPARRGDRSSSRPTASTPPPPCGCSAAGSPARPSWTRRRRRCSTASFEPGFRDRPAPQGPRHRHLGRPRGRRGHPARRPSSPSSWAPPAPTATARLDHSGLFRTLERLSGAATA